MKQNNTHIKLLHKTLLLFLTVSVITFLITYIGISVTFYKAGMTWFNIVKFIWPPSVLFYLACMAISIIFLCKKVSWSYIFVLIISPMIIHFFYGIFFLTEKLTGSFIIFNYITTSAALAALMLSVFLLIADVLCFFRVKTSQE